MCNGLENIRTKHIVMKRILIPTDFSVPAENAAKYGVELAKSLKADVWLCNAFKLPAEAPMAAQVVWPLMDSYSIKEGVTTDLDALVKTLSDPDCSVENTGYCPQISYESGAGSVCDVVTALVKEKKIDFVVMGVAGASGLIQFILGSNTKEMIEKSDFPILLIPYDANYKAILKIGFATDLNKDALEALQFIVDFAAPLEAEIVLIHVAANNVNFTEEFSHKKKEFFNDVVSKTKYSKIRFEYLWDKEIDNGLDWMASEMGLDVLSIAHKSHNFLAKIFKGSHTQKLSRHTKIPMLIFPPSEHVVWL